MLTVIVVVIVVGMTVYLVIQQQQQASLRRANQDLKQQAEDLQSENARLASLGRKATGAPPAPTDQASELLRLRSEVSGLRKQTNQLGQALAKASGSPAESSVTSVGQTLSAPLPEGYPKTAEGALTNIFGSWAKGDRDSFFANFGQPGVPRGFYDRLFTEQMRSNLVNLQILDVGEPTNGFGPNHFFVPYRVQFQDGSGKEFRLSIKRDPQSQRWYFDDGF